MGQTEKLPAFEVLKKCLNDYGYPQIYDLWYVQAKNLNTKIDPENPVKAIYDERIFMEWNDTDEKSVFWSMVHKAIERDNPYLFSDALNYLADLKLDEEIKKAPFSIRPPDPKPSRKAVSPDQVTPLERRQIALDILVALIQADPRFERRQTNIENAFIYADYFIEISQKP